MEAVVSDWFDLNFALENTQRDGVAVKVELTPTLWRGEGTLYSH